MNFRPARVSKLIKEELAKIILRELEFGDALVTITDVMVDKNLEHARVDVSTVPSEKAVTALRSLNAAVGHLQHLLMKKINIKPMPRISFEIDHGPENAATVEKIMLHE